MKGKINRKLRIKKKLWWWLKQTERKISLMGAKVIDK
jgi:hypothetical protein